MSSTIIIIVEVWAMNGPEKWERVCNSNKKRKQKKTAIATINLPKNT